MNKGSKMAYIAKKDTLRGKLHTANNVIKQLEHELTVKSENYKELLDEIESCDCLGDVSKVLRQYGR